MIEKIVENYTPLVSGVKTIKPGQGKGEINK